ncbi:MAG: family 1 glycosylhydrolase [Christensenellales bacterium]
MGQSDTQSGLNMSPSARRFGNRVKDFITLNEPQCFIGWAWHGRSRAGTDAPAAATIPMSHHVLKARGLAVRACVRSFQLPRWLCAVRRRGHSVHLCSC